MRSVRYYAADLRDQTGNNWKIRRPGNVDGLHDQNVSRPQVTRVFDAVQYARPVFHPSGEHAATFKWRRTVNRHLQWVREQR